MKRLLFAALRRAALEAVHRHRVRRVVAALDGCDFCPAAGDLFIDITPTARHVTARLACTPCAIESVNSGGARVLMGADGRPVRHAG